MARQVLPWVGAAVGFWLGGPAGAQFGFAIGGMIGNAVDPQVINGPKLGEGQDTTASEGAYRPIVLGRGKVGTCIINQGPLIKRTIRHKQSKGGGPVTTEERFYRTMAFAVGEPADVETGVQLLRMWVDGKLVYDVTPTSQIVADSQEFAEKFTFYTGTMGQQPDPDLEAYMGAGNVSAYQGAPYIVFPHYDVTQAGGRAPMIHVELASSASITLPAMVYAASLEESNNGIIDASPDGDLFPIHIDTGLNAEITSLHAAGGAIFAFVGVSAGRVSFDRGATWHVITGINGSGIQVNDVAHIRDESGDVWCFVYQAGSVISRTTNGINLSNVSVPERTRNCISARGQTFAAGGTNLTITISTNRGLSFSEHTVPPDGTGSGTSDIASIVTTPAGFVCGANQAQRLRHSPSGLSGTWSLIGNGLVSPEVDSVSMGHFNGLTVVICGTQSSYSVNGGTIFSNNGSAPQKGSQRLHGNDTGFFIGRGTSGQSVIRGSGIGPWALSTYSRGTSRVCALPAESKSVSGEKIPLSYIIQWCHERVDAGRYDVAQLTDLVEGVVFGDGYTAADAIRTAGGWYFFDAGEFDDGSGYRIHYVKRGGAAVATLTDLDIVEGPEDWEREDSYERPRVLHVAYQNPVMDYGAPTIPIKRTSPDVLVVGERSLSVPFVHSDQNEVARRGDIAMTVAYTEIAGKYEVILPVDWLSLAPTDTIGFSIRGRTRRLRMVSWRYSPDGTIKTEWMADRQSAYTSDLTALPPTPTTPPPPSIVGPTVSAVLDIPALTDSLDSLHLILAASGQTPAWWGSLHQRRLEAETDFSTAMVFNPPTTIMGVLSDDVSEASPHYTDTTNVVRVTLYSDDELDTHTQQQFLSENGAFALSWDDGGTQRWEILQYRDAVKVGDQEWELSTLARGRLDTTTAPHPPGSMFVLLDVGIRATPAQVAWIGQDIEHRAVSNGQQPDQAIPYTEEYTGQSQREWPVAHLFGELDGDDLRLTCVPRHRFGTDDNPVQSINHDGYRWTATDGSNSATAYTSTPSHTFDVTGWATPITVNVAQLNRITGAGPTVSETINA